MGWNLNKKKHENFKDESNVNLNRTQNIRIPNTNLAMHTVWVQRIWATNNK
jgi:hypothetical protein